ncbi:glycoside hydrolase family 38 C-terminal domain-containing protein [Solibaculum mannosilyticum]|uniref:glycoside hydrolase family 38 C-terminal domain-containing protein n=1 Tax=Solibaculum mannosilyticum TaxID=2780922 RepID=UPI0034B868C8
MKKSRKILAFALSLAMTCSAALPTLAAAGEAPAGNPGLRVDYYTVLPQEPWALEPGNLKASGYVDQIDNREFKYTLKTQTGQMNWAGARYTGNITIPKDGTYKFTGKTDDGARVYIDGQLVLDQWVSNTGQDKVGPEVQLKAGTYSFQMDYLQGSGGSYNRLFWSIDGGENELVPASAFTLPEGEEPMPEASRGKIYTIATAHLDTIWNWSYETTIREYIPKTMRENFQLFEDNPNYNFNFEGARRYDLMKEYYPEEYEKVKEYIADGRWYTAGSAWENGDQNGPSPEALIRNTLYGNQYFADEFGNDKRSYDIYLPDCFGFGYAMPSWMAHCNLVSFSTQKLTWGNAFVNGEIPFDIGKWVGPDGNYVMASTDTGNYTAKLQDIAPNGLRENNWIMGKLDSNKAWGFYGTTVYHGTGDTGGSPGQGSVTAMNNDMALNGTEAGGDVDVISASSTQWVFDMTQAQKDAAPVYEGEMLLKEHGVGSWTARAIGHRWNSRNELLGVAAEKSATAASWLGTEEYPIDAFNTAWKRVIGHQFHDDITATSIASEYERSWNDYMLSLNQFGNEYENAVGGVASVMDTSVAEGTALVVNNPVAIDRNDVVEATVTMDSDCEAVRVYDDQGNEVASQILSKDGNVFEIAFKAEVSSMGYRVFDVRPSDTACEIDTGLSVTSDTLSNEKYNVVIDANGDIHSIYDKELGKELLADPIRLGQLNDTETEWPAWELKFDDYAFKDAREYVTADKASKFEVVENGPARVAIKITREYGNSSYEQIVSLEAGGEAVEVQNVIDWQEKSTMLKANFSFTATNDTATYDLGLGAIERGNNTQWQAESPAQKWADITDDSGEYGVSVLSDSKNGWDKPYSNTLRLTLIHTPSGDYLGESQQSYMDWGENRFGYAIYGHANTYGEAETQQQAQLFTEPMVAFQTVKHDGSLGSNYSFASISNDDIIVRAVKNGEVGEGLENQGDEIIVRFNEGANKAASDVEFSIGNGIASVREVYGTEMSMPEEESAKKGAYELKDGKLVFDMDAYGIRTFAIKLNKANVQVAKEDSSSVALPYNKDGFSNNSDKADANLGETNIGLPSELIPSVIDAGGVSFLMGNKADRANNVVVSNGQNVNLPSGDYNKVYLLAFSMNGDKEATFNIGDRIETLSTQTISIADYQEHVGQWDMHNKLTQHGGYVKEDDVAYVATHHHENGADQIASEVYMFKYELDIPEGATMIQLPEDNDIVILSATAVNETAGGEIVTEMYDSRAREDEPVDPTEKFTDYSGFEANDPPSNVNTSGQNGGSKNSSFQSGPTDAQAHTGSQSHKLTVNVNGDGSAYNYTSIYSPNIEVTEDMYIEYWLYAEDEDALHMNIDMKLASGQPLRDVNNDGSGPRVTDQRGVMVHPAQHANDPTVEGTEKATTGKWQYYRIDIGKWIAGNTINDIMFAFDFPNAHKGTHTAYIDDLRIGRTSEDEVAPNKDQLKSLIELAQSIEDKYTADSVANLNTALDAAIVVRDNDAATQEEINKAVEDLNTAYNALELDPAKADKTGLLTALEEAEAIDAFYYTDDSYNTLASAIATGREIYEGLYSQEQIDQATADIYTAIEGLVDRFSMISDKDSYAVNEEISLTVTTPEDVKTIGIKNDRGSFLGISSISYKVIDGVKVWSLKTSMGSAGNRSIDLFVKEDGQWKDTGSSLDLLVDSAPIEDIQPSFAMATVNKSEVDVDETFTITAVTSTAIDRLQLTNERGNAISVTSKDYYDDGYVRIWKLRTSLGSSGDRTLTVKAGSGSEWLEKEVNVNITVRGGSTKPDLPPVVGDAHVLSLNFSADSAAVNEVFHGTAVTTTGVNKISIRNERDKGVTLSNLTYSDNGNVRTWNFDLSVGSTGFRMFDLVGFSDGEQLDTRVNCSMTITAK